MFYLEKLILSLIVYNRRTFVDGNSLVNDILSPMLYLHTFIFNIITEGVRVLEELISPPDVLSHALIERGYDLDCYTDYNPLSRGQYHIYSLPFVMDRMHIHSNKFPIGLFCTVRYLYVHDFIHPFEHEFFLRISQCFPLLNEFAVFNPNPQKKKITEEYQNEKTLVVAKFSHLIRLNLYGSYIDYTKQFLFDCNTCLPSLRTLHINYEHLVMVTENFANTAARTNCANLKRLIFDLRPMIYPENFFRYFPLL